MPLWDYSGNGFYYITIVTRYRKCNLGKIENNKPKSISSFFAGFKSAVTSKIDDYIDNHNLNIPKFNRYNKFWQPNYHDHIVRNKNEYWRIKNYIKTNPETWGNDIFNKKG